jgi:TIR domain
MPIIVISYRRQDSNDIARRIYEQLKANYGEKSVYIDIESIQPSADYRVHIRQTLERALVMLAVVGTEWRGVRADGSARIFEPDDPVGDEVETMLANRRAVMPVLVNGAGMPTEIEIPDSLRPFRYLHAIAVRSGDEFSSDIKRVFRAIDALTAKFWTLYVSAYLILPFVLALLCHYLLLFKFDVDPLYQRIAIAVISAALGIGLCFHVGFRALPAFITGAAVGLASAIGMLAISFALGSQYAPFDILAFIPSIAREWQEVIEYFAIVALVTLASNVIAWMFRDRRGRPRTP